MKRPSKVFLLGAGGMGMAPLAMYLKSAGVRVEAFDDNFKEPLRTELSRAGIHTLYDPIPLKDPDCIIRSSAIPEDCALLAPFKNSGIPIYRRGDFLAQLLQRKRVIGVAGSHGKTSVTGMLAWAFDQAGFKASHLVGGLYENFSFPAGRYQNSPWVLLELDESDGTIEGFSPALSLVLNCDWDHVDLYQSREDLLDAYKRLIERTKQKALVPLGGELHHWAQQQKLKGFGTFAVREQAASFYLSNLSAVYSLGDRLGVDFSGVDFASFPGVKRRQSKLFENENRVIFEDYAHHPTEIRSFLEQRSQALPDHLLRVIFQPHRFSRTQSLAQSFAEELGQADELHLLPTYSAFEKHTSSGSVESLNGYLPPRLRENCRVYKEFSDIKEALFCAEKPVIKDQLLFVGAGDIDRWANAYTSWEIARGDKHQAFPKYLQNRLSPETILRSDESLKSMTTMGVGGSASWYCEPANTEDLKTLVEACRFFDISRAMMGRGSNLIIPDEGYHGLVMKLRGEFWTGITSLSDNSMIVGTGARLKEICKFACKNGLSGFEFFEGIPGTLGGALRMNAGALNWETFDLVEWVSFLLPNGEIQQIPGSELEVGYRYCKEAYEGIALRAKLKASGRMHQQEIRKVIEQMSKKRMDSQPRQASSGCVFRNPAEHPAGWLIDQTGLKGEHIGGAIVSDKHANFIINRGDATAQEVIELIQKVRERVRNSHGLTLEPEVNLLGKSWNEYLS